MGKTPRPVFTSSNVKRPTATTRFHIDYSWWDESELDLKAYLSTRLPQGEEVDLNTEVDEVDLVDMETGEVKRVDGFEYVLQAYFGQLSEDFATKTPLAEGVFYTLLANANQPMSATVLAKKVGRSPDVLLKTLGGSKVYMGIRPLYD